MRPLALALALLGCDDGGTPGEAPRPDRRLPTDARIQDAAAEDARLVSDVFVPGGRGAPCERQDECEAGLFCRGRPTASGEVAFACLADLDRLCQPCLDDRHCEPGLCRPSAEGSFCARPCEDGDCPAGYDCEPVRPNAAPQCVPRLSCTCTPETQGATRPCAIESAWGVCEGAQRCGAEGWGECEGQTPTVEICNGLDDDCDGVADDDIPSEPCEVTSGALSCPGATTCVEGATACLGREPFAESCDGLDNDCDGSIDEDFRDEEDRYLSEDHCGACGAVCGRDEHATEVRCVPFEAGARCVVEGCAVGFAPAGEPPSFCARLATVPCLPCDRDEVCAAASPGAACVQLGEARFCGIDCGPESAFGPDCPEGFECAQGQCVPSAGDCFCAHNPEDFARACRVEAEGAVCLGVRRCQGEELGPCELPEESCDGLDEDCDGQVDEGFLVEGRYALDAHCARCGRDCTVVAFPNAESVCDAAPEVPACVMRCLEGFVDLDGDRATGCECEVTALEDHPDGQDRNCDGIDGQRDAAVFVAKRGHPEASGELEAPLHSVQAGVDRAIALGRRAVYVAAGVYSENVVLPAGLALYGGFSPDFAQRSDEHPVTLLGRPPEGLERATLTLLQVDAPTRVDLLTVHGVDAEPGASSYAVYVRDADARLELVGLHVVAGSGGDGLRGEGGGPGTPGGAGLPGGAAVAAPRECDAPATPGGVGGANRCDGVDLNGGVGGESVCPRTEREGGQTPCLTYRDDCLNSCSVGDCPFRPPAQAGGQRGVGPGGGFGGGGGYDRWSDEAICTLCSHFAALPHQGGDGRRGDLGRHGEAGAGCADPTGVVVEGHWRLEPGGTGGAASDGGGGGGGGAGAGYDVTAEARGMSCTDSIGGSGGGGGAGGCAGSLGAGGQSGGGAFGLFLIWSDEGLESVPTVRGCTFAGGRGGEGGGGGPGGAGGSGGSGAPGGPAAALGAFCSEPGGRGGEGGRGGDGGGGGGGCGGLAASIYAWGAPQPVDAYLQENDFPAPGQGGAAGPGGDAPTHPGTPGAAGLAEALIQR